LPSYEAKVTFMYLNVVLNGLQGVFLFLVYCVFGSQVREAVMKLLGRFKRRSYQPSESSNNKPAKQTQSTSVSSERKTSHAVWFLNVMWLSAVVISSDVISTAYF